MTKRAQQIEYPNAPIPESSVTPQNAGKNLRVILNQTNSLDLNLKSLKYRGQNGKSAFSLLINDVIKTLEDNGEHQENDGLVASPSVANGPAIRPAGVLPDSPVRAHRPIAAAPSRRWIGLRFAAGSRHKPGAVDEVPGIRQ